MLAFLSKCSKILTVIITVKILRTIQKNPVSQVELYSTAPCPHQKMLQS